VTELQGWLTIGSLMIGFLSVVFAIGVGWGWVRGELHRICERVMDGFAKNDKMHTEIREELKSASSVGRESRAKLFDKASDLSTRLATLESRLTK